MNEDENIDNIAQTFFLLMILCSVISDSHFVIHERSPRIQYLFDSLQALFIFGFTQKQQERIIWEKPAENSLEKSVEESLEKSSEESPKKSVEESSEKSVEEYIEKSYKVSFQDPIETVLQPEIPPKKNKLLEDRAREKPSVKSSKEKVKRAPHREVHKEKLVDSLLMSQQIAAPLRGAKRVVKQKIKNKAV